MTVTATYTVDPNEHYRALRAMMRTNPARWIGPVLGILIPAAAIWAWVIRDWDRLSPLGVLVNGGPWLLICAFYLSIVPLMLRVFARRAARDDPALRSAQTRIVTADGLEARGQNFLQRLSWADMRPVETREFFLFFYNRRQAYYIPRRALTEPDVAALRAFVETHARTAMHHKVPA